MNATAPPPGFYDDGSGRQRWWDGTNWSEHRQGAPVAPKDQAGSGTATVGYLLAIFLPFIGFLMGLALVARGDRHGAGVVAVSVGMFVLALIMISSS